MRDTSEALALEFFSVEQNVLETYKNLRLEIVSATRRAAEASDERLIAKLRKLDTRVESRIRTLLSLQEKDLAVTIVEQDPSGHSH